MEGRPPCTDGIGTGRLCPFSSRYLVSVGARARVRVRARARAGTRARARVGVRARVTVRLRLRGRVSKGLVLVAVGLAPPRDVDETLLDEIHPSLVGVAVPGEG